RVIPSFAEHRPFGESRDASEKVSHVAIVEDRAVELLALQNHAPVLAHRDVGLKLYAPNSLAQRLHLGNQRRAPQESRELLLRVAARDQNPFALSSERERERGRDGRLA